MALKDLLLRRAAPAGNTGNKSAEALVTGKTPTEQHGNSGNSGNTAFRQGEGKNAEPVCPPSLESTHATTIESCYHVTDVTALKTKGNFGNNPDGQLVTAVTALKTKGNSDDAALGPDDPGDVGLEWHGEYEPAEPHPSRVACKHCGERINWQTDGVAFADDSVAHIRCYERHETKRQKGRGR